MSSQQVQPATMSVLQPTKSKVLLAFENHVPFPKLKFGRLGSPVALSMLAALDIAATLAIANGVILWLPSVVAVSMFIGFNLGKNDAERLQSLGVAMAATAFTWLGVCMSYQLGFGTMDERLTGLFRSFMAIHCGAIIVGHALAYFTRRSRVGEARRPA